MHDVRLYEDRGNFLTNMGGDRSSRSMRYFLNCRYPSSNQQRVAIRRAVKATKTPVYMGPVYGRKSCDPTEFGMYTHVPQQDHSRFWDEYERQLELLGFPQR